ncbi:MAG TPA: STAS/SEC14 domain-containing protein [Longimicrobiaceae bacterium]|nr:STAS/SEC14 domain-containing protein [Longimicrobiaceae bacterium]
MSRISTVRHRGASVVLIDLTHAVAADILQVADEARAYFAALPGQGLLSLTDLTGSRYDARALDAIKKVAAENRERVVASAVVSDSAAQRAAVSLVSLFSQRRFKPFDTRAAALDWLATQGA